MCGIVGYLNHKDGNEACLLVKNAMETMLHRGPDQSGVFEGNNFVLGHQRLSIIDLSNAGKQPYTCPDGKFVLTYNGEIYNYIELKQELVALGHSFKSQSDTEVLIHAWMEWGTDCIKRLLGMFAFCIIDTERGQGWLVRDAFGIKPLFYSCIGQSLCFASELPAIMSMTKGCKKQSVNWQAAYNFLLYNEYDVGESTFVKDVYSILPGTFSTFKISAPQNLVSEKWLEISTAMPQVKSTEEWVKSSRELFLRNIEIHLRSDAEIAIALSGGVDSSALAYAVRQLRPDIEIHTFSYINQDRSKSEEKWVDIVNQDINAISHKITFDEQDMSGVVDQFIKSQGEPVAGSSVFAQFLIGKEMQKLGFKVMLEGQGADEIFGGYIGYPGQRIRSMVDQGKLINAASFAYAWSRWPGRNFFEAIKLFAAEILPERLYNLMRKLSGVSVSDKWVNYEFLKKENIKLSRFRQSQNQPAWTKGRRLHFQLFYQTFTRGLPHLLRHADRNMMAHSIESRVPFLTPDFAQLTLNIPEPLLVSEKGETKRLMRLMLRGIVPDNILYRKDKLGFETSENLFSPFYFRRIIEKLDSNELDLPIINNEKLLFYLKNDIVSESLLWRLFNFIEWYEWFCEDMSNKSK